MNTKGKTGKKKSADIKKKNKEGKATSKKEKTRMDLSKVCENRKGSLNPPQKKRAKATIRACHDSFFFKC